MKGKKIAVIGAAIVNVARWLWVNSSVSRCKKRGEVWVSRTAR